MNLWLSTTSALNVLIAKDITRFAPLLVVTSGVCGVYTARIVLSKVLGQEASAPGVAESPNITANSSTPTPVFRPSREETQTMVREKLGPKLRPPQTLFLLGKGENSDHGLSFWGRKTQTMVWVSGVFGVGVDEGALANISSGSGFELDWSTSLTTKDLFNLFLWTWFSKAWLCA